MAIRDKYQERQTRKTKILTTAVLLLVLTVNVLPVEAVSNKGPGFQTAPTFTFNAEADARVEERNPNTNRGTSSYLEAVRASNRSITSYLRFTVSGLPGPVREARLRVYSTSENTKNGPALYSAENLWTETGITWNNRPALTGGVIDNKGSIARSTWVEYNVTARVTNNGTYSFVLAGDSNDNIRFSSREGDRPPQLVVTLDSGTALPTVPPTPTRSPTFPPTSITTLTSTPILTRTPTSTRTPASTATATSGSGTPLTFTANADARVVEDSPATNYGSATTLQADGDPGIAETSYIRFSVSGLDRRYVHSVKLRVFCSTNATSNGPAVHLAESNWIESGTGGITWNTKPALLSGAVDNRNAIGLNSWVEYDVTALVTGEGTYTFALVADSNDGVTFSSREGATPPQLVVTVGTSAPTASPTAVPTFSPTPRLTESVVLVGAGDIATCDRNQDELTAQLVDGIPGTVFTLGDNVYVNGSYTEYVNCYDPTWGRHKARTKPIPGNHEYNTSGAAGYFQYFNNIPAYYAYDAGPWRVYALNSEIDVSSSSPQVIWLQNDLAANPSQCVLAYWHKPRWSSGTNHGSNAAMQTLWQVLYNAGAEVVINSHEHHYERFAGLDASGAAASPGLREFVVGTGGAGLYPFGAPLPGSEVRNNSSYGVLKLTLHTTGYDWQFLPAPGSTFTDSGSGSCH